jgi:hypothetical protein
MEAIFASVNSQHNAGEGADCHRDCHRTGEYKDELDGKRRGATYAKTQHNRAKRYQIGLGRTGEWDFKTGALNHSATLPSLEFSDLAGACIRGKYQLPLICPDAAGPPSADRVGRRD